MKNELRIYGLLTLATTVVAAHVIGRIFFAPSPFEGAWGLLGLYGETATIGTGLAMLRVLEKGRDAAKNRVPTQPRRGWTIGSALPSYDISRT